MVSHDRDFLDQTVTKILSFEGDGNIEECVGGYSDYLSQKISKNKLVSKVQNKKSRNFELKAKTDVNEPRGLKKLTYKLEFELKNLPKKIQTKEKEISSFNKKLSDPNFYKNDTEAFIVMTEELENAKADLEKYETRWLELEAERDLHE